MDDIFNLSLKEFNNLMIAVDNQLSSEGYDISIRPIRALRIISIQYSIPLPITEPPTNLSHESIKYWPISNRIYDWYNDQYNERLKMDMLLGKVIILIGNDPWAIKIPRFYGSIRIIVSKNIETDNHISNNGPAVYNILNSIDDITNSRIERLSDLEMEHIVKIFFLGLNTLSLLEGSISEHNLIKYVLSDIKNASDLLIKTPSETGLSKWASLQASEKAIKAAIELSGKSFKTTHSLDVLSKQASEAGLTNTWQEFIPFIQCSAGIRYGEETCTLINAVEAHHASLSLIQALKQGGARFTSNLEFNNK